MDLIPFEFHSHDQWLGAIIGIIAGLVIQGEGQAFFVLMFQNLSEREKPVYDLNPLHHIDPRSFPVLLLTGWGWGKKRVEEPPYFPRSWIARSMVPLTAPLANMILAGVLGTIYMFLPFSILKIAIEINILIAMANFLVPIPPMALGRALCCPFQVLDKRQATVETVGAAALIIIVAVEFWAKTSYLQSLIIPPTKFVAKWVLGG
jgi:hypothetical protein